MNFVHAVQKGEASAKGYPKVKQVAKHMKPSSVEHFMGRGHIDKSLPKKAGISDIVNSFVPTANDDALLQETKLSTLRDMTGIDEKKQPALKKAYEIINTGKPKTTGKIQKEEVSLYPGPKGKRIFNNSFFSKKASSINIRNTMENVTAYQRGFLKAALEAGLSEGEAVDLFKASEEVRTVEKVAKTIEKPTAKNTILNK